MSILGTRLKKARKNKGFTQDDIAKLLGTTYQTISNYERGTRDPDTDTLSKFANTCGVSVDWLLGNSDDPAPPHAKKEKPNHEEYVLSVNTLADAGLRIAELFEGYIIDEDTALKFHRLAYKKFGLPSAKGSDLAAHLEHDIPGTGVFDGDDKKDEDKR